MAKCIWHLEKAHRNRIRQHLKAGEDQLVKREVEAEQANQLLSKALREGWATPDLVRCLYRAGDKARPYRPQDVHCAVGAFLRALSNCAPLRVRFEAYASELQLDETERRAAAAVIGVRLPEQPEFRDANVQVEHALASRSLTRRARRRQLE